MRVSFDIDDFLAYLLSGALIMVALYLLFPQVFPSLEALNKNKGGAHMTAMGVIVTAAFVLLLGHISSIINRYIIRFITRLIVNPREKIFKGGKSNSFWSPSLKKRIYQEFECVFCYPITSTEIKTAPRLIRSYVLNNYNATLEIRKRIVRARSLCGNSIFPFFLFATYFMLSCNWALAVLSLVVSSLLLVKQIDLDQREWKEIYTAFVARK